MFQVTVPRCCQCFASAFSSSGRKNHHRVTYVRVCACCARARHRKEVFKIIWKVGLLYHAGSLALGSALVTFLFAGDPRVQFGGILWKCTFFCSLKSHSNRNTLKHMKHVAMWLWSFGFGAKLLKPAKGQTWQQSAAVEGRLHHLKVWYTAESWYS